jgi:hypothetical protein
MSELFEILSRLVGNASLCFVRKGWLCRLQSLSLDASSKREVTTVAVDPVFNDFGNWKIGGTLNEFDGGRLVRWRLRWAFFEDMICADFPSASDGGPVEDFDVALVVSQVPIVFGPGAAAARSRGHHVLGIS